MSKDCNCIVCKFNRGEFTINEILCEIEKELNLYLSKLKGMDYGTDEVRRNENGDWCEADVVYHSADETGCLLDSIISNDCETKEEVIKGYKISLILNDIHREYHRKINKN